MFQILVVEDDANTAKFLKLILTQAGYHVLLSENGKEALKVTDKNYIDLILLDVMMPEMDGYEFTQCLRSCGDNTPILMLTAKQLPEDKCRGFILGVDDYVTKPIHEEEILLRSRAILRRSQIANEQKLHIGKIMLDYNSLTVKREDESYALPQKEFYLLYKLLSYPDKIFTRIQLMDEIWGMSSETVDTTINVHITRLRRRFENWPEFEIKAIRGIGYKAVIHQND